MEKIECYNVSKGAVKWIGHIAMEPNDKMKFHTHAFLRHDLIDNKTSRLCTCTLSLLASVCSDLIACRIAIKT